MSEEKVIKKFLDALQAEIGYHETGYNVNKFSAYMDTACPDWYNGKKNGFPWCCVFPHAVACQLFGEERAMRMFCITDKHNDTAGCSGVARYYREAGHQIRGCENLRPGDQIVFGSSSYDHTGILLEVIDPTGGVYWTVEGNYSDSVCKVKRRYSEMIFVGRPDWSAIECKDDETETVPAEQTTTPPIELPEPENLVVELIPDVVLLEYGDEGYLVGALQMLLNYHGYRLNVDKKFGILTKSAVLKFQKEHGLKIDGIVGRETWNALIKENLE